MTLPRFSILSPSPTMLGAVVCSILGWVSGPACMAPASEVISAIPGNAQPPITPSMLVETIEAGTRGPAPAPHHGCTERCHGATCAHGHCGRAGCRHGACGVPGCPAHCPVRPASFGFYGTQWRTWPGQEVVQATHVEPAAPVMPPKSEVPSADEESPVPGFEMPAPEPESTQAEPADAAPSEPPSAEPSPTEPLPTEPAPLPAPEDRPKAGTPKVPAEDNLFDEAARRRRSQERLAMLRQTAVQQERLRHEALRQQAQRMTRQASATGESPDDAPSAVTALPSDRLVVATPLPAPEAAEAGGPILKQAVHAEPESRGLRDAARKPLLGNPLR